MKWVDVPDELLEESRRLNDAVEELLAELPSPHTVPLEVTRARRREGGGPFPVPPRIEEGVDRTIPGPAADIPLRIFVPERVEGAYLHIHGGGFALGAQDEQDTLLYLLAQSANVAVVSVGYRLAPEHPFPAGPDDCEAAARWLVENAGREFGAGRLVIGGESAGAHLSALTLLRLRDRYGAAGAFCGANLVFGVYDLSMTPSSRNWGDRNLILSLPVLHWFNDLFTPGLTLEQRRDPAISPLYADLRGLPPALFTVGDQDPLLDDSLFMAARWRATGNEAELSVYPESMHAFHAFPTGMAKLTVEQQIGFVKRRLEKK